MKSFLESPILNAAIGTFVTIFIEKWQPGSFRFIALYFLLLTILKIRK